jgi:hypothetical protein
MKRIFCLALAVSLCSLSFASDSTGMVSPKKVFKRGYIRLGISLPGGVPISSVSALQNFRDGNMGAGMGFHLDAGHIFYFLNRKQPRLVNVGLDWTIASLSWAPIDQWQDYAAKPGNEIEVEDPSMMVSISTKLGPVVAINPVGKLVIEARAQLTYGMKTATFAIDEYDQNEDSYQYFSTTPEDIGHGFGSSFGLTVRYGFIGLAVDYSQSNIEMSYEAREPGGADLERREKFPFKSLECKLSFTF